MDEQRRLELTAAAFAQLPYVISVFDAERMQLLAMTDEGRAIVGDWPDDLPLAEWNDVLGDQLVARFEEARSGAAYGPSEWRFELTGSSGERVEVYVDFTVTPVRDVQGDVVAIVGSGQDVSARVRERAANAAHSADLEERIDLASDVLAQLHDSVLPKGLPVPQGVELAARYLLAEDYAGAGGDWFDAIPLPDGRVAVVVGDVVGHGIEASVTMGELKTLFEERIRWDGDLVAALELLEARAGRAHGARSTTLCVCVVDTRTGELVYCTAGHPPPVLVAADGSATYLPTTGAGPLCSGLGFEVGRRQLAEEDLLLLYTDGLVERPRRSPGRATVELLQVAEAATRGDGTADSDEQTVERVTRQTLESLTGRTGYSDDITLLALQLVPPVAPLELTVAAVPDAVRTVRADLGEWLARLRVTELDLVAVQHAVGELVSNVVQHAYGSVGATDPVSVGVELTADGFLELAVADRGQWREPAVNAGGRGLALARGFLDSLDVDRGPAGTTVRGSCRLSHPASILRGTTTAPSEPRANAMGLGIDDDVLHLAGSLDVLSAEELRHACTRASRGGTRPITINLTEIDLLSSAGVQALFDARSSGPVELVAPMGSAAQHVLDLVHLPYRT